MLCFACTGRPAKLKLTVTDLHGVVLDGPTSICLRCFLDAAITDVLTLNAADMRFLQRRVP